MKKLESFTVNRILVSIHSMNLGQVIVFSYSDNTVEYRDRGTMMENFVDDNLDRIWHLAQIGFTYPDDEPCMFSTFANICANSSRLTSNIVTQFLLFCSDSE